MVAKETDDLARGEQGRQKSIGALSTAGRDARARKVRAIGLGRKGSGGLSLLEMIENGPNRLRLGNERNDLELTAVMWSSTLWRLCEALSYVQ